MAQEFLSRIAYDSLPTEDDVAAIEIEFLQEIAKSISRGLRERTAQVFRRTGTPAYSSDPITSPPASSEQWAGQPNQPEETVI
jgi:hypothetical protein